MKSIKQGTPKWVLDAVNNVVGVKKAKPGSHKFRVYKNGVLMEERK